MQIFDFEDYRIYLNAYIKQLPKQGHGFRSQMAEVMRCEPSYVSRVLKEKAHIQLEQAEALNQLLQHSSDEIDYFTHMVLYARAGTSSLQEYFQKKMYALAQARLKIRNRLPSALPLSLEHQSRYFSHWQYSAIHMLLLLPYLQKRSALQKHLNIPSKRLYEILDFLVETGLVVIKDNKYQVGPTVIQLPGDSPLAIQNHINWRQYAAQTIANEPDNGLHYSSVLAMSRADAKKIRELYIQAIEKMNHRVDHSSEETVVAFLLDFFSI